MSSEDFDLNSNADESDFSDADLHSVIPLSTSQLSTAELRQSLKDTQLTHQKLAVKYRELRIKYDALKTSAKTSSTTAKKGRQMLSGEDKDIAHAGGRFALAYELWIDESIFERDPPSGVDPLNSERYSSPFSQELAIVAELYSSLPSHLKDALKNENRRESFRDIFRHQLKSQRSNMVYAARNAAGELLKLDPAFFRSKYDRSNTPELQALLHNPLKPEERYPVLAPMLFPNGDCNSKSVLAVEIFPKFLKSILHGSSTLGGGDPAGKRTSRAGLWGMSKTTPGMIAVAATILTFVCGPDQTFTDQSKGPSGINWRQRFMAYKKMILRFPPPYYKSLLSWYDSQIFNTPTSASAFAGDLPPIVQQDINDVDDLILRMSGTDVISMPTLSSHYRLSPAPSSRASTPAAPAAVAPDPSSPAPSNGSTSVAAAPHRPSPNTTSPRAGSSAPMAEVAHRQSPTPSHSDSDGSDPESTAAVENDIPRSTTLETAECEVKGRTRTNKRVSKGMRATDVASTRKTRSTVKKGRAT